jgi:hypothetical protein
MLVGKTFLHLLKGVSTDGHTQNDVDNRTTHYPRTFQSGGALMLGLLPEEVQGPLNVHTQEDNNLEPLFGVGLHGSSRDKSKVWRLWS